MHSGKILARTTNFSHRSVRHGCRGIDRNGRLLVSNVGHGEFKVGEIYTIMESCGVFEILGAKIEQLSDLED